MKPRVKFCWYCGRKLYGKTFIEKEMDGHMRILHKTCAETKNHEHIARDDQLLDKCIHVFITTLDWDDAICDRCNKTIQEIDKEALNV